MTNTAKAMETIKVFELPDCDICKFQGKHTKAKYDARLVVGGWASVCEKLFQKQGTGLGLGKGQKLIISKEGV